MFQDNPNTLATIPQDNFDLVAAAAGFSLQGDRVRFKKGSFVIGRDEGRLPLGTRLEVRDLCDGWTKFADGKLVAQIVREPGTPFPLRGELDEQDETEWPSGLDGKPTDPWSHQFYVYAVESESTRDFTLILTGVGGRKAAEGLARQVKNKRRYSPRATPVVVLAVTSWMHKTYGPIQAPALTVIDWIGAETLSPKQAIDRDLDDEIPF